MAFRTLFAAAALAAIPLAAAPLAAADAHETVTPVFQHAIPNIPGRSLTALVVSYPPGVASAPHRHAGSAFIYAYVLSGAIRSQVDDEPVRVYRAGESWYELPGAHHRVSENASATEAAQLLAIFVAGSDEQVLTTPDAH
ncbi:MAG TPA: cupin domain-containing protein [Roseomonas sp.]